ncbi:MAG: LCP family protein [Clostridia bacterium]|nr:LCP family protein [Clostridia bacterium]
MKKVLTLLLIFSLIVGGTALSVYAYARTRQTTTDDGDAVNCLVLGKDQSSGNTDVMILVGYRPVQKSVTLMQIPRDTYYNANGEKMKINHLYPACLSKGMDEKNAISFVADALSTAFAVPIHGSLLVSLDTLSAFVDEIGGVPMNLPIPMQYHDEAQNLLIDLPAGERTLTGKEAVQFVRFRSDYLMGDIARLDAQKIFLASLYEKLKSTPNALEVAVSFLRDGSCVFAAEDSSWLTPTLARVYFEKSALQMSFLSMPGEASVSDGLWYYTPNKQALYEVLRDYFAFGHLKPDDVDSNTQLCKENDSRMENIYFSTGYSYKIYTQDEIKDITITKKE